MLQNGCCLLQTDTSVSHLTLRCIHQSSRCALFDLFLLCGFFVMSVSASRKINSTAELLHFLTPFFVSEPLLLMNAFSLFNGYSGIFGVVSHLFTLNNCYSRKVFSPTCSAVKFSKTLWQEQLFFIYQWAFSQHEAESRSFNSFTT